MQKKITVDDVYNGFAVASPLTVFDCSLITDGAAFIVIAASDVAKNLGLNRAIKVIGSGQAGSALTLAGKKTITTFESTLKAADIAYKEAGLTPKDIDLAEVHDCFTITQIINTEDLGFFTKGQGAKGLAEGKTARDGIIPINTSGGLKAKGHPIGATGLSQIYEIVTQLRGEAGERQVKKADIGLSHNLGGTAATCVINIFSGR
jgi:acetyl-CoA acetyltransferase